MSSEASFFNLLDYVYITLMGVSCLLGAANGFARTFLNLCAWIGSGFLASATIPRVYSLVKPHMTSSLMAEVVASTGAYLLCLIVLTVVARLVSDMVKKSIFSGLDRALGLLFGLLRGIFLPVLVAGSLLVFGIPKERYRLFDESQIFTFVYSVLREIMTKTETGEKKSKVKIDFLKNKRRLLSNKRFRSLINKMKKYKIGVDL